MAHIPSFEELLTDIHQGLGLERDPRKKKFINLGMELDNHVDMACKLIMDIFEALGMDGQACADAVGNAGEFGQFHKALELRTWTGNASQKQVVWHLLAYSYVPALARRLAFWTLHNIANDMPALDAGMPGGKFWYLPHWDMNQGKIELPIHLVLVWLLDLLGEASVSGLQDKVGNRRLREEGNESAVRTLQYWLSGTLPKSAEQIAKVLPEDSDLTFPGAFSRDESLSGDGQYQAAQDFIRRKGLNAETLRDEIPMTQERLESILAGTSTEEEKQAFVRCIAERYAKPAMPIIRRRLQVARMVQDGYQRLLTFLCPGVESDCTDPARNKPLQLIRLFELVHNLTIAAWKRGGSAEEQDAWFETQLFSLDREDLLLSILPSLHGAASYALLAEQLTRKFMILTPDSPLEDLVPFGMSNAGSIIERRHRVIQQFQEEDVRLAQLIQRVRTASPWRALQSEDNYSVISRFALREDLTPKVQAMALERMRHLARPEQKVEADVVELSLLLHGAPDQWPKDVQRRVQSLLDDAEGSPGYEEWKSPLLRFRAKHQLFQNDFSAASKSFKAALDACSERAFGGLRGEIARDGFATAIAFEGFNPQNQEHYYRNLLGYTEFPLGAPSYQDAAVHCEAFFWSDLYHPYPGLERQDGPAALQFKAVFEETTPLIGKANWDGLREWMRRHAKQFREKNLKDARRDSVLLHWLKMLNSTSGMLRPGFNENYRTAIYLLLEAWPEQAQIADFKGQTPLMLVADKGDAELTRLLVSPHSDVDAQDFMGRTALHAAVSGRSPECVAIVLEHNPDVALVTAGEENTALHTAVRFGVAECVRLIAAEFPGLVSKPNATKQTPLDMAHKILEILPEWQEFMRNKNRKTGSREDFEEIVEVLAQR